MESFEGKLAVVTGGGTGMGRELVIQLATEGAAIAMCDVNADNMGETALRAAAAAPEGTKVTTHLCDVADEEQVNRFRDEVLEKHNTDHIDLLFNNAGVGGGGSFIAGPRHDWDRTFGICWGGVYNCTRAFMPLLVASAEGHITNTSSVNGFWASLGPGIPHTAYSAAKFAVKGFTEALMEDCKVNAPHVGVSVVMPGHIGTDIVINSRKVINNTGDDLTDAEIDEMREGMKTRGIPVDAMDNDAIRGLMKMMGEGFRDSAPMTAAAAATVILDGVKAGEWRILVGDDAHALDEAVRKDPKAAYAGLALNTITDVIASGD
jgi:NAD(P)-dependent dehydrogenase (short-subunit alcohol dehydrogenase family)